LYTCPECRAATFDLVDTLAVFDPPEAIISRFTSRLGHPVPPRRVAEAMRSVRVDREGLNPRQYYVALNEAVLRALGVPATGEELLEYWFNPENYRLDPCAMPLLRALRESGIRTGIVSNNLSWEVEALLRETGIRGLVDAVATPDTAGAFKPSPAIFLYASRLLSASPREALHVGDSYSEDYLGALSAGMHALLLARHGCPPGATCVESLCLLVPGGRLESGAKLDMGDES